MNNILIIGGARGGTTLIKNLFSCFNDVHVLLGGEADSLRFLEEGLPSEVTESNIVLKTHYNQFDRDRLLLAREQAGGKVLFLIRDPRDTVVSYVNKGGEGGWNYLQGNCALVCETIDEINPLLIRYEDLCRFPDETQQKIADYYGLEIAHPFSRGNERYQYTEKDRYVASMGGGYDKDPLRPIDITSIGMWKTHQGREQAEEFANIPEVAAFIERFYA